MLGSAGDGDVLIYVGDGYSDRCPVEYADLVFAKGSLQTWCQQNNISYLPYRSLDDVRRRLETELGQPDPAPAAAGRAETPGSLYDGSMSTSFDIRAWMFRNRSYTPLPFLIVMVLFAEPTITSLAIGFAIVLLGESIRFWGVSIAGAETRTTGTVGGTYLITTGPFAYVRNPLYVGNMLMYAGVGVMSMALFPWLLICACLWFYMQYTLIISREEEYLTGHFGAAYDEYRSHVPRLFPRLTPYTTARAAAQRTEPRRRAGVGTAYVAGDVAGDADPGRPVRVQRLGPLIGEPADHDPGRRGLR